MALTTQSTTFTRDIIGRYVCNTFAEAVQSGPFDVVIIGGGTFGLSLAQDLFFRSSPGPFKPGNFRILVLEAGPFSLLEHVQDIPNLKLASPGAAADMMPIPLPTQATPLPSTLQLLTQQGLDGQPLFENWGLPWNSNVVFGGLAYTLGGRSLYFGGWSPQFFDTEMPTAPVGAITADNLWPEPVVQDLKARFFGEAAEQTGTTTSNDYINGDLHDFYRKKLFDNYNAIPNHVPLAELPDYIRYAGAKLQDQLNNPPYPNFDQAIRLDAPLAVQIETRPGFFPFNKFSSVPLAITAARDAEAQSGGSDLNKRLMIVPNCHVKRFVTRSYVLATGATVDEVVGIDTSDGPIDLSQTGRRPLVVLAMGAIESARMAMASAGGVPNAHLFGSNLLVHLRKNVAFRVPALPAGLTLKDEELTVLLVRCRTTVNGAPAHFHLQITGSALPPSASPGSAEALLFQSVPDLDHVRVFANTPPGVLDVVIRAVGEMFPNPANQVTLTGGTDEYGVPRASVNLTRTGTGALMSAMDQAIDNVAQNVFGITTNAAGRAPDGLGTTFHESGTLRMGDDPSRSVVNADSQFHYVTNLYAGDASVLPTCGSANPVLNGIAIRRRLAKRLVPEGEADLPAPGSPNGPGVFTPPMPSTAPPTGTVRQLFDGGTLANWRMCGRGTFHAIDGALQSVPSFDLGLLWCTIPMPQNYRLELDFLIRLSNTNSGVFVRFRNPELAGMANNAWSAVSDGFEIQIDNSGAGQPPGLAKHRTGVVYSVNYPGDPSPDLSLPPATPGDSASPQDALVLGWNHYRIDVQGNVIRVNLNGNDTARYTNNQPGRGQFLATEPTFIGLQSYSNYSFTTAFRNVQVTVL
jgi:hypothetical protein